MTIRTGCSAALVSVNEACAAIQRGECKAAIVGGCNLLLSPGMMAAISEGGAMSKTGSCKTFSADADGYARAEAVVAIYIKPLNNALRDGNPIRAVIRGTANNSDGNSSTLTHPNADAHESLIRNAYRLAGISDFSQTAFLECHGTGTPTGDPVEADAIARVFGKSGIYIGSVKANLGHSEGASGLTSLLKCVLALENQIIPPNIKFTTPNPKIPFDKGKLTVPTEAIPWPKFRLERASINSFGIGGSNAHTILDSARSFTSSPPPVEPSDRPHLLVFSANAVESLNQMADNYTSYIADNPNIIADLAYTLANRRQHMAHRAFLIASKGKSGTVSPTLKITSTQTNVVMVFTGQGAQWPQMGRDLLQWSSIFRERIRAMDQYLSSLSEGAPEWKLEEELCKSSNSSRMDEAELAQPLCTAIQIALVDLLGSVGIIPAAVVGHSSGEMGAAYAAGALTANEAIMVALRRGSVTKRQTRRGAMAAIGMGWDDIKSYLLPNVSIACENSPNSVTISGDAEQVYAVVNNIHISQPNVLTSILKVDRAYHSYHMAEIGEDYLRSIVSSVSERRFESLFFSSVTGKLFSKGDLLNASYWRDNLESPVLFSSAISNLLKHSVGENSLFLEVGPHSALAGPLRQILADHSIAAPYAAVMLRRQNCVESFLSVIGKLFTLNVKVDFQALIP
jgi:acyl transferase domain-containing protein